MRAVLDPVGGSLASDLVALLADGGSFIDYGDLSGQPISIPPLSFPVRGLTMKGISVGRWAGFPEVVRTDGIGTAIELARTASHPFPVATEYDLAQITDAVVHAEHASVTMSAIHDANGAIDRER